VYKSGVSDIATWLLLVPSCAVVLSIERLFYIWVSHAPSQLQRLCTRAQLDPVAVVEGFFLLFKVMLLAVVGWWCFAFGHGSIAVQGGWPATIGIACIIVGQSLSTSVFLALGQTGVFHGGQFGRAVPHVTTYPFSVFRHPQYLGAIVTIWGVLVILRFPHSDWWVLPALQTVYYKVGARLEQVRRPERRPELAVGALEGRRHGRHLLTARDR
jgi:phosphatidyl-N-methylethanolamine N-methyltransferase